MHVYTHILMSMSIYIYPVWYEQLVNLERANDYVIPMSYICHTYGYISAHKIYGM